MEVAGPLTGGHRNTVLQGLLGDRVVVIRHSERSEASLHWEFDLLEHLSQRGVLVSTAIPTADGRPHVHPNR